MPTRPIGDTEIPAVPFEYSGKWVAWNADHSQIVASGDGLNEVWRIVHEREIRDPVFEKIPRANVRLIGIS